MNQAIHSVDLLLWLMGSVVEVSGYTATLAHDRIEVEDVATAHLKFASGALGVIEATTAGFPGSLKKIELSGSQGTAILEEEDIIKWEFAEKLESDEPLRRECWAGPRRAARRPIRPPSVITHGRCFGTCWRPSSRIGRPPSTVAKAAAALN